MKIEKFNEAKKGENPYNKYNKYLYEIFNYYTIKIEDYGAKYDTVNFKIEYRGLDRKQIKSLYENFNDLYFYIRSIPYSSNLVVEVHDVPKIFFEQFDDKIKEEKYNI